MCLNFNKNQGVVLLYAVLLVSIVLTISLSLMNIAYKQIILTAVNKESQVAHFVALSALDCARFTNWKFRDENSRNDMPGNPFGIFSADRTNIQAGNSSNFVPCGSTSGLIRVTEVVTEPTVSTNIGFNAQGVISSYKLSGPGLGESCAEVTVAKIVSGNYSDEWPDSGGDDPAGSIFYTALGYNTCDQSPRLIERRIRQ